MTLHCISNPKAEAIAKAVKLTNDAFDARLAGYRAKQYGEPAEAHFHTMRADALMKAAARALETAMREAE